MIGDRLYLTIATNHPTLAARVTGMLLELNNDVLMSILDSDVQLGHAVGKAIEMLGTTMAVGQSTQHGLAHPPTWAHHL
eukprot:2608421-Lingulodinium_polyedra.AAC.1